MTGDRLSRVVVVDDEPDVAHMLRRILLLHGGLDVVAESSAMRALDLIARFDPQLVFTDLVMPELGGSELLSRARAAGSAAAFVVVSAYSTIENAVDAIKAGASDFLAKPFEPGDVGLVLARVQRELDALHNAAQLRQSLAQSDPRLAALIGASTEMRALREWIARARQVNANALIWGDTGTGKELVARALHAGPGPFVAVNVAAIAHDLAESELFGHKAGAFSGAARDRRGLFAEADGGTLFLDEINGMDLQLQAKVLRAIEEKCVRPVGSNREEPARFRLVAASNEPLDRLIEAGRFRRDLFHRLQVLHFRLPSLAERRADIPMLAQEFVARYASAHGRAVRRLSQAALDWLSLQPWPGNVRQLENFIERAVIFAADGATELGMPALQSGLAQTPGPAAADAVYLAEPRWTLAEMERRYVQAVLRHTGGNKTRAAQLLDIDYKTLLRKCNVESHE